MVATRRVPPVLLLAIGVLIFYLFGRGAAATVPRLWKTLAVVVVCSFPPVYHRVSRALQKLRNPSGRSRRYAAFAVFLLSTGFLVWSGFYQHRDLVPKIHDEYMHLLQMQMLAHGRLWLPPHPAADSFESFHIFVRPVYASMYFPGTAMIYAPAVWMRSPYWLMPALVAGAGAAMLFLVVSEMLDAVYGGLASLLLVSLSQFRYVSLIVISHSVMLLLGLILIWSWLRWREDKRLKWAVVIGAIGGWAAITRPVDALCYAIPIAVAMLWAMRGMQRRRAASTVVLIVMAASPFLVLQLAFNVAVTGRLLETPYHRYCELYLPQMTFGFHRFDPSAAPQTTLPQRIEYYNKFVVPAVMEHRPGRVWNTWWSKRLPLLVRFTLPSGWLIILLPSALPVLRGPRLLFAAVGVLFLVFYACFAYLLRHYLVVMAPAVIVGVLLGVHAICESYPRLRPWLVTLLSGMIVMFALHAMPPLHRIADDDPYDFPGMVFNSRLASMVQTPALVLYHYDSSEVVRYNSQPTSATHEEPVYNVDVAWPDDAPVIRAQDRSAEQNRVLFRYYAHASPNRRVYFVDRGRLAEPGYRPQYLGTVQDLANERQ